MKKEDHQTASKKKFKVLDYSTLCFDLSRLDKRGSSYRGQICIENDLKGNDNCFELAGCSSYRGFEFLRVKLQ